MRTVSTLLACLLVLPLALTACGDDDKNTNDEDAEPFDTLQECFDEHHVEENFDTPKSIVICCLDHPIKGVHPSCGTDASACTSHVRDQLDSSVTDTEIDTACADYENQL